MTILFRKVISPKSVYKDHKLLESLGTFQKLSLIDFSEKHLPAQDLFFETTTLQPDTVLMVTVALSFKLFDGTVTNKAEYLPAAVIGMGTWMGFDR
ncbi:hypothetical protein [Sediminibacterium goheungense]|uniref:Uncharacterized protein n=1 Tax=Sediminibacterium goheungense TaxID=1086393 RepID=A0A4R6IZ57_9BACT|nr:hypothetical protein [Sediminibacterium goheungense]TDO28140.1 hypothetical protein BC659_0200 [Sediminibacterium goheungense]